MLRSHPSVPPPSVAQRDRGRASGDQVRGDARPAMRHGPADMPVPSVVPKVAMTPAAEDRQVVGSHRPQTGPHLGAMIVGAIGIQLLCYRLHEGEVRRLVGCIVASELRGGGYTHAV